MSDLVPDSKYNEVPPYRAPRNAEKVLKVLVDGDDIVQMNMAQLATNDVAIASEYATIIASLERLIIYLVTGDIVAQSPGILFEYDGSQSDRMMIENRSCARLTFGRAGHVSLTIDGNCYERTSRLAYRLGQILAPIVDKNQQRLRIAVASTRP
jgi:hypothetical protein